MEQLSLAGLVGPHLRMSNYDITKPMADRVTLRSQAIPTMQFDIFGGCYISGLPYMKNLILATSDGYTPNYAGGVGQNAYGALTSFQMWQIDTKVDDGVADKVKVWGRSSGAVNPGDGAGQSIRAKVEAEG